MPVAAPEQRGSNPRPGDDPNEVVKQWTPLVKMLARSYSKHLGRWYEFDDLVAIGQEALWGCISYWREDGGAIFKTFAYHAIVHRFEAIKKYWRSNKRRGSIYSDSIEDPGEGRPRTELSIEADDQALDHQRALSGLRQAFGGLQPREGYVLEERFLGDRSLKEVGQALGVSRERARQLERRGLQKLRRSLMEIIPELRDAPPVSSGARARSRTDAEVGRCNQQRARRKVALGP